MTNLRQFVSGHRDELVDGAAAPGIREDVDAFLDDLDAALAARPSVIPPPEELAPGIAPPDADVLALTQAFGALHARILTLAGEAGVEVGLADHHALTAVVTAAIAKAATKRARRHEWEIHHLAHQLRNPLGSAMMAITLVRGRVDFGGEIRLIDLADRNLKKLQGMIDDAVGSPSASSQAAQ
jgi:signal transduction histidine kinase